MAIDIDEKEIARDLYITHIALTFTEREAELIKNCNAYVLSDPAGLPGHNLIILVHKLAKYAGIAPGDIRGALKWQERRDRQGELLKDDVPDERVTTAQ